MLTSKTRIRTPQWCDGYDEGYATALRRYRETVLADIQTLQTDARLGLVGQSVDAVLDAVQRLVERAAEEAYERFPV